MDVLAVQTKANLIRTGLRLVVLLKLTSYLWPQDTPVNEVKTYDFIVIGGGTAGSILASRLSERGIYQVLLIEAGGDPPLETLYPSTFAYLPNTQYDWNFTTIYDGSTAQKHKKNVLELTSGKMLGGSSSLGHLLYIRGDPHDYNEWSRLVDDETWNYENLIPYFKKSEYLNEDMDEESRAYHIYHSYKGYMEVSIHSSVLNDKYLTAFREVGHKIILDGNRNETLGFYEPMLMIGEGMRQSMAYSYLLSAKDYPNLHLLKETEVIELNFEGNKAIGVTAIKNNNKIKINASREVIVSAGAIKSPHLLMLSGIGPKHLLEGDGIVVKSDVPVGKKYQDHVTVILVHKLNNTNKKAGPFDPHDYPFPVFVGNVALNTSQTYPDYQAINYVIPSDSDSILSLCSVSYSFKDEICQSLYTQTKGYEVLFTKLVLLHPVSKGHIVLESNDHKDHPLIISNFYYHDEDLNNMVKYIENFVTVVNTTVLKEYDIELVYPDLSECDSFRDSSSSSYWKCYALSMMASNYDYSSSCPMGSVVDSKLKVKGTKGLRVVDASVIPGTTSGGIQPAVMAIAEKGAEMILEDTIYTSS